MRPPPGAGLFPLVAAPSNAEPAKIVLDRPTKEHSFRFERPGGGWCEEAELQAVAVNYAKEPRGGNCSLDARYILGGGRMPNGFYSGRYNELSYLPVEVTDASPKVVEFRLPPPATYQGKVLLAPEGKPAGGAFVMAMNGAAHNNLALLTDHEWGQLGRLPAAPALGDQAVAALAQFYSFTALVRTDAEGNFKLTTPRAQEAYALIAFARDRLPYRHRTYKLEAGKDGLRNLPPMPLYPAAKVSVRPAFQLQEHLSVGHRWALEDQGQAEWAAAFRRAAKGPDAEFEQLHWLKLNERQPLYVPAGLRLKVRFNTPYHEQWTANSPDVVVALEPGQTRDLGDITFTPSAKISVSVLDPDGRPVEGIPLRLMHDGSNTWCVAHNTTADGLAHFYAAPGASGKITVLDFPDRTWPPAKAANVTVRFRLDKDGKAGEPCVVRLTKEQIAVLLAKGK